MKYVNKTWCFAWKFININISLRRNKRSSKLFPYIPFNSKIHITCLLFIGANYIKTISRSWKRNCCATVVVQPLLPSIFRILYHAKLSVYTDKTRTPFSCHWLISLAIIFTSFMPIVVYSRFLNLLAVGTFQFLALLLDALLLCIWMCKYLYLFTFLFLFYSVLFSLAYWLIFKDFCRWIPRYFSL